MNIFEILLLIYYLSIYSKSINCKNKNKTKNIQIRKQLILCKKQKKTIYVAHITQRLSLLAMFIDRLLFNPQKVKKAIF